MPTGPYGSIISSPIGPVLDGIDGKSGKPMGTLDFFEKRNGLPGYGENSSLVRPYEKRA